MISWFERHNKISWAITILIAIFIFLLSSFSFEKGAPGPEWKLKPILYHLTIFFLLTFFLFISFIRGDEDKKNLIFSGVVIASFYGISDEIHQFFIPGRDFATLDILINFTGILIATTLYSLRLRFNKKMLKL